MQNHRSSKPRNDRRDDARSHNTHAQNTSYRPRTQRKGLGTQRGRKAEEEAFETRFDKEKREKRAERPRHFEASEEGRYRPRTAKTPFRKEERESDKQLHEGGRNDSFDTALHQEHKERKERPQREERPRRGDHPQRERGERYPERNPRREQRSFQHDDAQRGLEPQHEQRSAWHVEERNNRPDHSDRRGRKDDRPRFEGAEERRPRFDNRPDHSDRRGRKDDRPRFEGAEERRARFDNRPDHSDRRGRKDDRPRFEGAEERRTERGARTHARERVGGASPFAAKQRRRDEKEQQSYFGGLNRFLGKPAPERGEEKLDRRSESAPRKVTGKRTAPERLRNESPWARDPKREAEAMRLPIDLSQPMRLNRYIAHCGTCSRRDADEMITAGEIMVNGNVCTTLGEKILPLQDVVTRNGEILKLEQKVYILLNKPKDYICTVEDPHAEHTVLDLVKEACAERIYPVGRLDRNTTGLLILTNDGALTDKLTHPSYAKRKTYEVTLDRKVTAQDMEKLLQGITLEDGELVKVDEIAYVRPNDSATVGVTIHTGQNRVVRRMFDSLGFRVERLDRVLYAGLTKRNLPRGTWRYLTDEEVRMLKNDTYR